MKNEGAVFPPFPLKRTTPQEAATQGRPLPRSGGEPRCEMCGASVLATHCKRICLRCGFLTGCSEGI